MTNKLAPPAPLDNSKLHTRAEYRAWQSANFDYHATLAAEENRERMKAAAEAEKANRILTDDEYDAMARQREAARQQRQAEMEAERQAAADAKAAYMESMPDVAEIAENNPYSFLVQVCHWSAKGYQMSEDADLTMLPNFYSLKLQKPASTKTNVK